MLSAAPEVSSVKERVALAVENARMRYRRGENPFVVAKGYTRVIDDVLEELFRAVLGDDVERVALVAVGGYGREELCPYSDLDLLFLREKGSEVEGVAKLVRVLWDAGFHLGHSVRTPEECYGWMVDDASTASAVLESRFLCGNTDLFGRLLSSALWRFRRRRQRSYVAEQLRLLGDSLGDPARSIYVIEPQLKEGICGLRDIQRVRWIENVRRRGSTFDALLRQGAFAQERVLALEAAYSFYLRVRSELHCVNKVRMDTLDRDSQGAVARNLGYGDGLNARAKVEMLMGDHYRHARSAYRFLRYYLETETRGRRFFGKLRERFFVDKVSPFLHVYKRWLYLSSEPPKGGTPEEILDIFCVAQKSDARLSESICEWVRQRFESSDDDYTHSGQVMRKFVSILRNGSNLGSLLKSMRETGVLRRVLPEFARLDCLVSFDGHHHFTVDAHTLRTFQELDRIASEENYRESGFREVYKEIGNPLPLRVALLLHDIGKAFEGNHSVSGSELALLICERLGLDENEAETVEFLVYRHLELFKVSERRDLHESAVIGSLARVVESEERLKMLYLLTYIDVTSVGPGTWTGWKGAQLAVVYERTLIHLRTGQEPGENLEDTLAASGLDVVERGRVLSHCQQIDTPGYHRETLPERMLCHVDMVDSLRATSKLQISTQSFGDYHEITFCAFDRRRLFMDLTGLLFSEGFNVLGARIFSRRDGFAIDQFYVEIADGVRLDVEKRIERIHAKVDDIRDRKMVIGDIIRQRTLSYRTAWRKPLYGPRVVIDNETSDHHTVVEVNAGDRPGLLFELAMRFHHLGLDVVMAKVSTFGERVHDTFYVLEEGGKIDNPARRLEIEHGLVKQARVPGRIMRGGI